MGLVWTECIRQANEMLDFWKDCSDIRQTGKDVRRFSLHVLTSTGFGKSYHFDRCTDENVRERDSMTYKDSLSLILENCILIMFLGPKFLTGSLQRFLPMHWRLVGQATSTFKKHIAESISRKRRSLWPMERLTEATSSVLWFEHLKRKLEHSMLALVAFTRTDGDRDPRQYPCLQFCRPRLHSHHLDVCDHSSCGPS
jgi:hypothetical protein